MTDGTPVSMSSMPEKTSFNDPESHTSPPVFNTPTASTTPKKSIFSHMGNVLRWILILVIGALLLFLCWGIFSGLENTVSIETRNSPAGCQHDSCIAFKGHYVDREAVWEVQKGWPLKLIIRGATFSQNNIDIVIRCPVNRTSNDFLTKLSFLVAQDKINECDVVSK